MLPQRSRPQHECREFIPRPKENAENFDAEAEATLSLLCQECERIRDWVRDNLEALREISPLEEENCFNTKCTFAHHKTGAQLHRSSEDGCHLCTIIWENLIEEDSYFVRTEHHWTSERERMIQQVEKGDGLSVLVSVPRSVHTARAFGSYREQYLAFATLRAYIRIESDDDRPHSSNPIMLSACMFLDEVDGVFRDEKADKLKPFKYRRPHDSPGMIPEATYNIPQYDSDTGELLSPLDLKFRKIYDNVGPRELRPSAPLYTGSNECIDTASKWLLKCAQSHHRCALSKATTLPTRLIDISSSGNPDFVRLVESKDLPDDSDKRYACLSYCWGRQEAYTLKLTNIDMAREGIDVTVLPQTIRDAIVVARRLGLNLIWIDALCIIQDSKEDWEREATRMCDVYEGCFICIAAKGASSGTDGLFSQRDPLRHTPCHLFTTESGDFIYVPSTYVTARTQHRRVWALDRRGWVVQERVLPPRTINFGSYLSWECRQGHRDEFDIDEVPPIDRLVTSFFSLVVGGPPDLDDARKEGIISLWMRTLAIFSATDLTVNTDRYAALYGIITAIKRYTGWSEVAGIWEPYFIEGLCWEAVTGMPTAPEPRKTGLYPSWSWISVACEMTYIRKRAKDEDLVNIEVQNASDLETGLGGTSAARLSMNGILIAIKKMTVVASRRCKGRLEGWPSEDSIHATYDIDVSATPISQQSFLPLMITNDYVRGLIVGPSTTFTGVFERLGTITVCLNTRRHRGGDSSAEDDDAGSDSGSASFHNSDPETDEEDQMTRRSARRETLESYERRLLILV